MLIAAGVLAIGMLGVMALIPLIAMRLQEGEIADRSAVLSRNAVQEVQVRGWTNPTRWRWYRYSDGVFVNPNNPPASPPSSLPFTPSICIDPLGMTGIAGPNTNRILFPYAPHNGDVRYAMQRVLPFNPGTPGAPNNLIDQAVAELMAVAEDDLLFERPESRADLPRQTFPTPQGELIANSIAQTDYPQYQTRRMAQRDYSLMATLTPLDNVKTFQGRGNYLLSVAVFYQRSRIYDTTSEHVGFIDEDITAALSGYGFASGGVSGGEVAINCSLDVDMINLAKGDWVMLTYPAQLDTSTTPATVLQAAFSRWYQVIEAVPYDPILEPNYRFVTLAGPDWPFVDVDNPGTVADIDFPDDTQVTWLPGVVQVSEKTISLGADATWE